MRTKLVILTSTLLSFGVTSYILFLASLLTFDNGLLYAIRLHVLGALYGYPIEVINDRLYHTQRLSLWGESSMAPLYNGILWLIGLVLFVSGYCKSNTGTWRTFALSCLLVVGHCTLAWRLIHIDMTATAHVVLVLLTLLSSWFLGRTAGGL